MNRVLRLKKFDDDFQKMLAASLALHLLVILFFTVKAVFFPSSIPKYIPTVRVDLVGLPEKRNPDKPVLAPPKPKPEQEVKVEEKPKPTEKPKAKEETKVLKKTEEDAIKSLKTKSAIEKIREMTKSEAEAKEEADKAKKKADTIRGNKISPGTALSGLNKIDFDSYIGSLDEQVKSHWVLPEWMASLNLKAIVLIKIDKNGQITEKTFVQKSGNADYDSRVMAAIDESNPFPAPPGKFVDLMSVDGFKVGFPE